MNDQHYHKKILPYLDGSLTPTERSEFEAFVRIHPEFEEQIKSKESELERIKNCIPAVQLLPESREALEAEMKLSIHHLLKEEPKSWPESIIVKIGDWFSR